MNDLDEPVDQSDIEWYKNNGLWLEDPVNIA